ncbi:MAG: NAD(P)(+) transhydrogenase (Re/Si-specific) subunit beta, partial [Burkholderiales bacterium]
MSANQIALAYLVASVVFILSLRGLSSPVTARRGNLFGMAGMALAVLATITLTGNWMLIVLGIAVGGSVGALIARRIQMTQMPELVAAFHSLVGLAAVLIAIAAVHNPGAYGILSADALIPRGNRLELFIGTFVGAITFSGSVIAFGKLSGKIRSAPVVFAGQHWLNLWLAVVMILSGVAFMFNQSWTPFAVMTVIAFVLGVLMIIPIGGADMPVVISMLNSYSGWAAAGIGFSLNNTMLIISGSLVGSSGA